MSKIKGYGCLGIFFIFSLWFFGSFFSEKTFAAPVDFPKKEITVIVNMAPGGGRDIITRIAGMTMSKYLGVPIVVMNTLGGGGARGLMNLYHSAPDGYTIGTGMATDIVDQIIEKREYDAKKFSYIGRMEASPSFWWVRADSPFRSLKDFKTFGHPLRFAAFVLTSISTVAPMIISIREDFPMVIVGGYKGSVDAATALIRGEAESFGSGLIGIMPFCQSGQIRPFMTLSLKRSPDFPDIHTVGEMGHLDLGMIFGSGYWLMAPPGVPKARIQILEDALMKTLADPDFLKRAKEAGLNPTPLSSGELTQMVFNLFGVVEKHKGDIEKYIIKK